MNIALSMGMSDREVRFARQLGLKHVVSGLPASPSGVLEYEDLKRARDYFDAAGLSFDVIENLPVDHYYKSMFGLPGRDEEIEKTQATIRNMGRAGINVLQYQWMLLGGLRTEYSPTGRGASRVARFDEEVAARMPLACQVWRSPGGKLIHGPDRELSTEDVWDNLLYFLRGLAPAAEKAGVKLAVHPDDPPMPSFMGVARIMTSLQSFQRLIDSVPSPCIGLGFCQGTISAIPGVDIPSAIRHFGGQGRIFFAHFRNSIGTLPRFDEVFPDEGDTDLYDCARAYRDVGFDGLIRIDHSPGVIDDENGDRGFGHQVGYAKALDHALDQMDAGAVQERVVRGWHSASSGPALQLALTANCFDDTQLVMAQQMGVDQIVAQLEAWDSPTLAATYNRVHQAGLRLTGIDALPPDMYDKAVLGLPGRDAQIAEVCEAIRRAGAVGIRLIGYAWTPPGPSRTAHMEGRGGALVPVYDQEDAEDARPDGTRDAKDTGNDGGSALAGLTKEQIWENLDYFLRRVLPEAEAANVRLACRPDDPPVASQGGLPRILCTPESFTRLARMASGPSHGFDLWPGAVSLMPGANVVEIIRRLGEEGKLAMVTLDPRRGRAERFRQTFLDEDCSLIPTLLALKRVGFVGPIRAARPARLECDTSWGHKGRAFDLGYLRSLMQVVERMA